MKKNQNVVVTYLKIFKKIYSLSPLNYSIILFSNIIDGIAYGIIIIFQKQFYDVAILLTKGNASIRDVLFALMILGAFKLLSPILGSICRLQLSFFTEHINGLNQKEINMKLSRLSPTAFENTEVLDNINKASQGMLASVDFVMTITKLFINHFLYFVIVGWFLFSQKPILVVTLIIIFIPVMASLFVKTKIYTKVENKSAPKRREANYYESCCVSRNYYKETRLLGVFGYFYNLYKDSIIIMQKLKWKADVRQTLIELGLRMLSLSGYLGIFYMIFVNTMNGDISIGAFVTIINSISALFTEMEMIIIRNLGSASADLGKVRNYLNLLEMDEHGGEDNIINKETDINIQGVSFTYPQSNTKALDNISLTVKNKETIAIVGENGSGKSTLVRLIVGLYRPTEGNIFIGENNTKNASLKSSSSNTSGIFQKVQRYQMSLKDNIVISDFNKETNDKGLYSLCDTVNLDIDNKNFPVGFDTMLSVEFGGVDLSGGQWQRLAIARGFYREHQLIVLDEPTAAIDPLEERNIYEQFANISKDKTTIIVTHRLGSVKLADRIVMLEKGKVVGIGKHIELYNKCIQYAELWDSQASLYV